MAWLFNYAKEKLTGARVPRLLQSSWRPHIEWTTEYEEYLRDSVKNFTIHGNVIKNPNVLMVGYIGTGKSSFYNSCLTAVTNNGRVEKPFASGRSKESVTTRLHKTEIEFKDQTAVKLNLFDCTGLHEGQSGITNDDLHALIEGKIPVGYEFKETKDDTQSVIDEPQLQDKMHCIVIVIDASKESEKNFWFTTTITDLKKKYYYGRDIQLAVLLTHADRLRGSIGENTQHVFLSSEVQRKVAEVAKMFSISEGDVLPMVNYFKEQRTTKEKNILALFNMLHIMGMANDYVKHIIPMEMKRSN